MDYQFGRDSQFSAAAFAIAGENSSGSDSVELFRRVEDKFLLPRAGMPRLLELLNKELEPCYYEPGTRFNAIESVYFDSTALQIFREHFQAETKFKIRLRRYGPNGVWPKKTEPVHLEMKTKSSGVCQKFRLKVENAEMRALFNGQAMPIQKKKEKAIEKRELVNHAITQFSMKPLCRVRYERLAYEKNGLRVTIDDKIQAEILNHVDEYQAEEIVNSPFFAKAKAMRDRFSDGDYVVVEVKHSGTMPNWLNLEMNSIGALRVSFSKYAYSIVNHLLEK